jgi:hypothetical protein
MRYGFVPDRLEETVARTASRKEILEGPIVRIGMLINNVLAAILALVFLATVDWYHKVIEHTSALTETTDEMGTSELIPTPAESGV